jgi:sugar diacid utilization regulator
MHLAASSRKRKEYEINLIISSNSLNKLKQQNTYIFHPYHQYKKKIILKCSERRKKQIFNDVIKKKLSKENKVFVYQKKSKIVIFFIFCGTASFFQRNEAEKKLNTYNKSEQQQVATNVENNFLPPEEASAPKNTEYKM